VGSGFEPQNLFFLFCGFLFVETFSLVSFVHKKFITTFLRSKKNPEQKQKEKETKIQKEMFVVRLGRTQSPLSEP